MKFGKRMNSENGRVPNIVYGYNKTIGDYFNLEINQKRLLLSSRFTSDTPKKAMEPLKSPIS